MRWTVSIGHGRTETFDSLPKAKKFAKEYLFADIYENVGEYSFLRFTVENNKLKRTEV
jgi:hypothetical protein